MLNERPSRFFADTLHDIEKVRWKFLNEDLRVHRSLLLIVNLTKAFTRSITSLA